MSPAEWIALAGLGFAVLMACLGGAYKLHRWLSRIEAGMNVVEHRSQQLVPNGNRPLDQGGHLADALHRTELKLDMLGMDIRDQREALSLHVTTSDLERAALRQSIADLKRFITPNE